MVEQPHPAEIVAPAEKLARLKRSKRETYIVGASGSVASIKTLQLS